MNICPYSPLGMDTGNWVVVATKKCGMLCSAESHNIHSKLEKNPREKTLVASPPQVFHSDFSLVCCEYLWIRFADLCMLSHYSLMHKGCKKAQSRQCLFFLQLIFGPGWSTNQLYNNPNIA